MKASGIVTGPLFRPINRHGNMGGARLSPDAVAIIVKHSAGSIGIGAAKVAGHSLRSGLATSAADAGASNRSIKNQTGHRSDKQLEKYIRQESLFRENAVAVLNL